MKENKKTNAVRELERLGIALSLMSYEVDENDLSAVAAAGKVDFPLDRIFKTLVLRGDDPRKDIIMACIPGAKELDLKKLASLSGNKKLEMVHLNELLSLTGYVRGGCSPVGTKKGYPVYIDESAMIYETISVSAGQRGLQMILSPDDLIRVTEATVGSLIR